MAFPLPKAKAREAIFPGFWNEKLASSQLYEMEIVVSCKQVALAQRLR